MIKYIKSMVSRNDIHNYIGNLRVSIAYINKNTGEITREVEGTPEEINNFILAVNGVEVSKPAPSISPARFMFLFPFSKLVEIRSSQDPIVKEFLRLLDDPRLLEIDRNTPFFNEAIIYLSSLFTFTQEELDKIKTGV